MQRKKKISVLWALIIIWVFLGIFIYWANKKATRENLATPPSRAVSESPSEETSPPDETLNIFHLPSFLPSVKLPQAETEVQTSHSQETVASDPNKRNQVNSAAPVELQETSQQPSGQQESAGPPSEEIVNAPLSDEQISEQIKKQNEKRETLKATLEKKDMIATQVRRSAELDIRSKALDGVQAPPEDFERAVAPADIIQKLQSRELVGH